ncbi:MAG TPA: TRAP transporter TatT component family protein, partial [Polyangiales bacterium]|nr:TRAP transporter TatT component family protein [Polyangiales bacterium]
VDMPVIKVIAQHIAHLDEGYEDAGALVFLGGLAGSYPRQFGGEPELAKKYFDRALELTQRHDHIVLVNYAIFYCVNAPDRALFEKLLHEVVEAGDQGAPYRLANKVAKRRALRLLARTDELFP